MFGSKPKAAQVSDKPAPTEPEVQPEFEYTVVAVFGAEAWIKETNRMARLGWELVNGMMAGTANYAYMRRRIDYPSERP